MRWDNWFGQHTFSTHCVLLFLSMATSTAFVLPELVARVPSLSRKFIKVKHSRRTRRDQCLPAKSVDTCVLWHVCVCKCVYWKEIYFITTQHPTQSSVCLSVWLSIRLTIWLASFRFSLPFLSTCIRLSVSCWKTFSFHAHKFPWCVARAELLA